ncbi:hypothetical protein AAC387_Pa07g2062 [Persea americana]
MGFVILTSHEKRYWRGEVGGEGTVERNKIQWPFNDYSFCDPGRTQQQVLKEIEQGKKLLPLYFYLIKRAYITESTLEDKR